MKLPNKFIKATEEFNTFEKHVPAPYIRKSFVSDTAAKGKIIVAVCGFYELFINGEKITKGFLAPYISNTDDYIYCDEYEIQIDKGENVIALILGNGFQNNPGGYIWDFHEAAFRSAPLAAVSLCYKNAADEVVLIESDTSFKWAPSPVRSDDYRFGVIYDANCEIDGWCEKGFDDSDWQNVIATNPPRGELKICEADPIITETELRPVRIFKEDDSYVYDFGMSNAGVCRLCVEGTAGQVISLQHGDILKDGKFFFDNLWFMREHWERDKEIVHKDVYTCRGSAKEVYTPPFVYHGFRYVKVSGITSEQATEDLLTYVVFHSGLKTRGGFTCSDETVNKLQEITRRSDLSNFHYFPTDCPQREKNGWTGDAALSAEQMTLNFAVEKSYREWLNNIRKSQHLSGRLPGIVPTTGWGYYGIGPSWDSVLAQLPYYTYIYRGDTKIIKENAHAFVSYLDFLTERMDNKGLVHFGLRDWCHVGDIHPKAPLEVTDTVVSMDTAYKMAFMLDAVKLIPQRNFARAIGDRLKKSIRTHLVDFDTMTVHGNCQASQAMCLYYGVFTPDEEQAAANRLVKIIEESGNVLDIGVLGARTIFHVLTKFGHTDLAYKMIVGPGYPSYGNWLERGATTLWENFHPENVCSPNHHFWGDISAWFIKRLAGIQFNPQGNDITKVDINPSFASALDFAEGWYEAPAGRIVSSWKRDGERIVLNVEIPVQITATAKAEKGYAFEDGTTEKRVVTGEYIIVKAG